MPCYPTTSRERLSQAVAYATGAELRSEPSSAEPKAIRDTVASDAETVVVTGTLDRRLLFIEHDQDAPWTVADLSGNPHSSRDWPEWTKQHIRIDRPHTWLSTAHITEEGRHRLTRPRLLLVSLYHPEYFPLPRFPLAISDLARAARATLMGGVELMDMQLGPTLHDIVERVRQGAVDILGVSVTFGQHDLATQLLDEVNNLPEPPLILAGGSLTARNERILLQRYPELIICRGAGEPTIADVLAHWHGDLAVEDVRGVGYRRTSRNRRQTATVPNRLQTDMWPELDLLDATLRQNGVAQLETSRGCTNFCSFCPRSHKGQWAGAAPDMLPWILQEMASVFDRHPHLSKTMYLVDEEFIGRGDDAVDRALRVADMLADAGFTWETSCRIDQVVRLDQDRSWHIECGHMWRNLVQRGLRRCLFGVESGVDTILARFNKETTSCQNTLAIRALTALGVPPRFTYITFDHLMNYAELRATYEYQGRTDLVLKPLPHLAVEEIVDGVHDGTFVAEHTTGEPFYTGISYLLVGMECLIGAAYTHKAKAAGLTGAANPLMGRVEARYADWRIGVMAHHGQLWVDRNFALDYTLKSIEKIVNGPVHHAVRAVRRVLKSAAYRLLGGMVDAADLTAGHDDLENTCRALADNLVQELRNELGQVMAVVEPQLSNEHRELLHHEYRRWVEMTGWRLINAADPCGT